MAGATVRPDFCPQPHRWGHSQTGVCLLFPSLRGGIHCGVVWPIWATCTLPGLWRWVSGVLAGVDRKVHRGGRGRLSSLFLQRSASGGALQHREGVRPAGGMDPQKHSVERWVFAPCKQVPWQEMVPFGILAGGWAREMALVSAFVPRGAELCRPRLNNSPSHCPPALPFSKQSC